MYCWSYYWLGLDLGGHCWGHLLVLVILLGSLAGAGSKRILLGLLAGADREILLGSLAGAAGVTYWGDTAGVDSWGDWIGRDTGGSG